MVLRRVKRTHLELPSRAHFRPPSRPAPPGARVEHIVPCPTATWRALYRAIGERWHWHDHVARPEDELAAHLLDARVVELGLRVPDVAPPESAGYAGWAELIARAPDVVEIQYFGLVPQAIGRGFGGFLLTRAVEEAWAMGAERIVLDTCTLDAPQALPNYLARGFVAVGEEWYEGGTV